MQPNPEFPMGPCATDCNWGNALTLCLVLGYIALCQGAMLGGTTASHRIKVLIYLSVLCVGPCSSVALPINPACQLKSAETLEEYEYMQEGDILIGGVMTLNMYSHIIKDDSRIFFCQM
ncbi:hypothetical protein XENTR_v10000229 [Xenopus tropicalis]|nr:hypothetical protein XENTR_v10000229 [Xenopus tropicalis]